MYKKLLLVLLFGGGVFLFLNKTKAVNTDIIITEVGASEPSGYEWVEIFNKGTEMVDLTSWKFWEADTNHGLKFIQGDGMILGSGEYAIITQDDGKFLTKYSDLSVSIIDSSWSSLKESGEEIGLKDAEGNFVEQFVYISAPIFSLERKNYEMQSYLENNWIEHPDSNTVGKINYWSQNNPNTQQTSINQSTNVSAEIIQIEKEVLGYEIGSVVINEFLSDAFDEQAEFVELYNNSGESIDLTDWWIEEGSGKKSILGGTILANSFFILEKPKGSLNNTGDIIKLFDPTGGLIDKVAYGDWNDGNINDNAPKTEDPLVVARIYDGQDTDIDRADFVVSKIITKGASNIYVRTYEQYENTNYEKKESPTSSLEVWKIGGDIKVNKADNLIKKIIISEFIPNPAGSDDMEFIELYNPTDEEIDLTGLQIDDEENGSGAYTIAENTKIAAQDYLVFGKWETKLSLNNDSDSVRLLFEGEVIIEIAYSGATEGASYALTEEDDWQWTTTPTPGKKNIVKSIPLHTVASGATQSSVAQAVSLENIYNYSAGDKISTEGIVAVLPGILGTQYFYITDGNAGVQVYMHSKAFPELKVGDRVKVSGEISLPFGETRIKVSNAANIKVIGSGDLTAVNYQISELGSEMSGALVEVEGEITELKSAYAYIDDGSDEIKIYFKKDTGLSKADFSLGEIIKVKGILINKSDELQILLRSGDDLEKADSGEIGAELDLVESSSPVDKYLMATTGGLGSVLLGLFLRARGFFIARGLKKFGALVLAFVKRR